MPTGFEITTVVDSQDSCISTQQKAVYNWYENRHSDDDVVADIYSPEWQQRITSWHSWFMETYGPNHEHSETVRLREAPEELDFRSFFFEHPIATFSLWHAFQTFYDFDQAVCGNTAEAKSTLASWRILKPFEYLKSEDVERRWKDDLKKLDTDIGYGELVGEELKSRMYDILRAVERIETALDSLEDDFRVDYDEVKTIEWMLDTITDTFDKRCLMIDNLLKRNAYQPPEYEVVVSDPEAGDSLDGSLEANPPPNTENYGFFYSLLLLLDFNIHMHGFLYVVLTITVASLSLYFVSRLEDLGTLSKNYE